MSYNLPQGTLTNVSMFGEAPSTAWQAASVYRYTNNAAHAAKSQSALHIGNSVLGSGLSGPTNADIGQSISVQKQGFNTGSAASGEIDGIYAVVRQDGADADCAAVLADVGNYGIGFSAAWESQTTSFVSGAVAHGVNSQAGVIDTRSPGQYGFVATKRVAVGGTAYYAQQTTTVGRWTSLLKFVSPGGTRFEASIQTDDTVNLDLYDSAGLKKSIRVNAGKLSVLNNAGSGEILALDDSGNLTAGGGITGGAVTAAGSLGYATGAGGTVTQLTSKSTGVTLNKICGRVITAADALASGATAFFTVTNSTVVATDVVVAQRGSGGTDGGYWVYIDKVSAGSFRVALQNASAGSLSEAVTINFAVIKAVTA